MDQRRSSPRKPLIMEESSSSSDDAEILGSPKKSQARASIKKPDAVLSGSVRSASYNIVFQVSTRIFTFLLNAFILRYVSHEVMGICNVRLALLYSTVMFLSREPFRRTCQRKQETDSWTETINLIWFVVPNTFLWSSIAGYVWCYVLSQPGPPDSVITIQYQRSVWIISIGLIIDSLSEVPYIVGQYFLFAKLRIIGDTALIAIRSTLLCAAVVYRPEYAVVAYAGGNFIAAIVVSAIYYGHFYWLLHVKNDRETIPFSSVRDFFPSSLKTFKVPLELAALTWSFFKQGFLKQILTEGERYMMTFINMLSFEEQGLYDLVSNLGSLAARFVFLPIEESSYFYFSQTLHRRAKFAPWDKESSRHCAYVLGNLVRLMMIIGSIAIVYGLPYSNSVLFLYGGENLSENVIATRLLQANCLYILVMAVNGITETFTFAAMTQDQLDKYNRKLVIFSAVFLLGSFLFVRIFGSIGFFIANGLNMSLRVMPCLFTLVDYRA
ncbi:unnamed protein product [Allacma fusca]|uniref:Protein RFT1 homolog n=1 Tax=Allacma fusca TaxID=39272 RepID=A0A8J2KP30_9HEXA|nr:unnamed protein product [Allacma fusca]